jgi:hypothetical protein
LTKQFPEFERWRHRSPHNSPEKYPEIAEPLEKLVDQSSGGTRRSDQG